MPLTFPVPPKTDKRPTAHKMTVNTHADVAAFRDCYGRFQECLEYRSLQNSASLNELADSFLLDFDLAARRAIGSNTSRYQLFQMRYLQGANRQDCCKTLDLEVFTYTSEIMQIERIVGRALSQRGLFPLNSYFTQEDLRSCRIAA
jgi:hypothetical protein